MDLLSELISKKKRERTGQLWFKPSQVQETPQTPVKKPKFSVCKPPPQTEQLTKEEVVFRLRKLKQPAIYFGEDLEDQAKRLRKTEEMILEQGAGFLKNKEESLESLEKSLEGDLCLYESSEYISEALQIEEFEDQGKVWKKGKWEHPFVTESKTYSYSQKTLIVLTWCKKTLENWDGKT